jgi:hypothetical protein
MHQISGARNKIAWPIARAERLLVGLHRTERCGTSRPGNLTGRLLIKFAMEGIHLHLEEEIP